MMKRFYICIFLVTLFACGSANSTSLTDHFFGLDRKCIDTDVPVLLVADITLKGEIDDSISLFLYRELERAGCIKVIGIVSIFGNGKSSTGEVHKNLVKRLNALAITHWRVLQGPERRMVSRDNGILAQADQARLREVAGVVGRYKGVVIAELGPMTVSASLLRFGFVEPVNIRKVLIVGGRAPGEHFATKSGFPFSFRDMNVAEDRTAASYLLRAHSAKLFAVTYRTGIGNRMITAQMVEEIGSSDITNHAMSRAKMLKRIGYGGRIPTWDSWTTSWFIERGLRRLGCRQTPARIKYDGDGYRPSDQMQLQFMPKSDRYSLNIQACHATGE